jgi:hypothetical protein
VNGHLDSEHRAMLYIEYLHGAIVVVVVAAVTVTLWLTPGRIPSDTAGVVYGAAIAYAGTGAARSRGALRRNRDTTSPNGDNGI